MIVLKSKSRFTCTYDNGLNKTLCIEPYHEKLCLHVFHLYTTAIWSLFSHLVCNGLYLVKLTELENSWGVAMHCNDLLAIVFPKGCEVA